jgi:hypothetical protein
MRRHLIACVVVVAVGEAPGLAAQGAAGPITDNDFGFSLSVTSYALKEKALNPLRHSGTFVSAGLVHERPRATMTTRFELELVFNPVSSRYEQGKDSFASDLRLTYRHARQAATLRPDLSLLGGGFLGFSSQVAYFDNWDDSHFYWLTAYSIGPTATLDYRRWANRSLSVEVSIPVLAFVSRPRSPIIYKTASPAFGWILGKLHEDMRLTSLHKHRAVDATLRFTRLDASFGRSFFWHVAYIHNDLSYSRPIHALRHSIGASVVF